MGGDGHMNVNPQGMARPDTQHGKAFIPIWGGAVAIVAALVVLACGAVKRAPRCGLPHKF